MLPPFISDAKDKHPTFILASYGAECYRHSFPTLKTNTRHLFLASYGAECYRHSFPTLKTNTQHLFLALYGAECYRHSFPTLKTNSQHFFLSVIWSRMLPPFISDANNSRYLFRYLNITENDSRFFSVSNIYRKFQCVRYAPFLKPSIRWKKNTGNTGQPVHRYSLNVRFRFATKNRFNGIYRYFFLGISKTV